MTPAQIIALVRDVAVLLALGWIIWRVYNDGETHVRIQDLKAVQQQLENNAQQADRWHQEALQAETQRRIDMDNLAARITDQRAPIIVRIPASPSPVPALPAKTPSQDPPSRPIDIRPGINAFELQYESALADCRAVLASWPQ